MQWNPITINESKDIREAIVNLFADTKYTYDLFFDNSFIIHRRPLEVVTVKKFPACAVFDNTDISFNTFAMGTMKSNTEVFYIQIIDKAPLWEDAKDSCRLIAINLIGMLEQSMNLSIDSIKRINVNNIKNLKGIEISPKIWTYSVSIEVEIEYLNLLMTL